MVHPLVAHNKRPFKLASPCHAVLSKHRYAKACNKLWYAVVYLRVNMVRPSAKHHTAYIVLFYVLKRFCALLVHILTEFCPLVPAHFKGLIYLTLSYSVWSENFRKPVGKGFLILKGYERVHKVDVLFP